jgi:hypothetical protein
MAMLLTPATSGCLAMIAVAMTMTVGSAQWITIETASVPRLRDGKPNLRAPTPLTADGRPDLSGIWMMASDRPCPDLIRDGQDCIEKDLPTFQAVNIGYTLPGGLPYQPWAAALVRDRTSNFSKDDPHVRCLPSNPPRIWTLPHRQKVIQTRGLIAVLNEFSTIYRQIFTDGRALPVDPTPSWNGYSTARWEGSTLVVDTIGLRGDVWLDSGGSPISEGARLTERIRRPDFGHLEIEITVDDPKTYTRPWTVTVHEVIQLNIEMIDEVCLENEKSLQHLIGK